MSKQNQSTVRKQQPMPSESRDPGRSPKGQEVVAVPEVTREQVAVLAYQLWESQGRPEGMDLEHWLEAERQLQRHA